MTQRTNTQEGFTLIELMIALAFIAFLFLFVFFAMNQVMGSYNKGLTVKEINQTARTVAEDIGRTARFTDPQSVNASKIDDGRVCFGTVSYVWNLTGSSQNKTTPTGPRINLVQVEDSGAMCADNLPDVPRDKATPMLGDAVWVQDLDVAVANASLINISISLSTTDDNRPTGSDPLLGPICQGGRDSQFCAVARFSTTVSTRNGGQ